MRDNTTKLKNGKNIILKYLALPAFLMAALAFGAPAAAQSAADIKMDMMIFDYKSAIEKCRALQAAKADLPSALMLAEALHLSGDTAGAFNAYGEILAKFPGEPSAYAAAARYAANQVKFEDAKKIYSQAVEKISGDPAVYRTRRADSDALFNSAIAFYDKMNLRSQEVELYKKTALGLYSEEPLFFSRACAYFIDRKLYGEARELIKAAEAKTPADGQLIFNARTGLYEKLIAEGVETSANAAELDSIYEKFLLDNLISDDRKYYTHTVYFNFLKNNSLLDKKIEKLTAAFGAPDGQQSDLLLINLLMQNSHAAEAKALVNKFVSSRKNFSSFISASRAMRHYSELLPAMKFALASLELASTVEEKETLYYELASNLSRFYFIDLRYLIFKNAAVELIEQRCDDLLVNLITISSSRRFMRANYDAIRVALRQYLSRLGAVHYYEKLIENKVSASRAKYLSELAEIYDDINMSDAAYACREKLCKDYTDSVYLAGALKSMVSYHQRSLKPDQAASKACAALTAYADIKSEKGFASARQALEQLMNFDAAGFDGEKSALNIYYRGVYDFLNASRGTAFDKKWIDSKLVSLVSKLELSFGARLEIIDGMLKNSPYDRELLKAKEGYLLSQVSLNDTAAARKALENFYEQNYFADGDFMNKYLQYLNRENLIESKIAELKKAAGSGAKAPHKLKLLAECCFFISDFEQSEKWFDEFVKYAPSDSASLMKLASLKRSFGKSGEAVKLLQQIISLEPSNKTAYITAGDIIGLDKSRPWAEAEAFFSKITSIDPENNDNYVELATIYWDYFKYDEGLAVLADRRRKAGSDFIFGREIASLFELNGSIEVAIPEYISVICAPDEPARDSSYQQFGGDGAENESENGRRYEHYNYRYERPETADVIECRARLMTLYKKEKFKKLIDAGFEKFMAASPLNYKLYYEYSKLLIEFGMGGKAFEVIKKSYPAVNRAYYFIQMAGLLERVRKNAEARELYYKAIAMEPESHSNYGDALDFFNRFAMEADYAKTVKMRAEKFIQDQYYMEEYAKYMMNFKSAKDNSNYREAVWALEKLIAQNPLRVSYRNLLADAKIKLEGMKAAIAYIEGVIAASESEKDKSKKFHIDDIVRLKETLARLLAKDRQTARALEIRKELIYDNPGERGFADSLAELALAGDGLKTVSDFISGLDEKKMKQANKLFLIARFYSKLNMFDEAADAYKKLAGLNPNDSSVVTSYFELCVRTRKFGEAKKLMPRYMQLAEAAGGETERQAYEDCVSLYMQTGDSSEACLLYDKYLKKILDGFKPDPASYVYYSYQYVNAIDWLVRLLESNSRYAEAVEYLERKLEHVSPNEEYTKYLINEINEKISMLHEKNGEPDKALELISAIVQKEVDAGAVGSVSESMLKRLVELWKKTGNYERYVKEYGAVIESSGPGRQGLDEKRNETLKFLLRVYKLESNEAAFIALVKKHAASGQNLNDAVEMAAADKKYEQDLIYLLMKRINAYSKNNSFSAQAVEDMIRLGVVMALNDKNSVARDFFGMALKYGNYNETLKKIAEKLLEKNLGREACSYYSMFLSKCSARSYYLNAPAIASAMADKGCYGEAVGIAENLLEKYGDDIQIKLDCASIYKSSFNKTTAVELFSAAAAGAVKVEQARQAVDELRGLLPESDYRFFLDTMIAARQNKGFDMDYAFLLNEKAAELADAALFGDKTRLDELNELLFSKNPPVEAANEYMQSFFAAAGQAFTARRESSPLKAQDLAEAVSRYFSYGGYFAEKITKLDNLAAHDASSFISLVIANLPEGAAFKDVAALINKIKPFAGSLPVSIVHELYRSRAVFDNREAELTEFFKSGYALTVDNLVQAARLFIDDKEYAMAGVFAQMAASMDSDDQTARLAKLETLCGLRRYDEAAALAGSVEAKKLYSKEGENSNYGSEGDYSYEHVKNMIRFAECLYELKLYDQLGALASVILEKSRKYFYNEDAYLANQDYKRALELYFDSFVTAENRAARRSELVNALDAYITHIPRYGQAVFEHEKIISRLASILYSWDAAAKKAGDAQSTAAADAFETYMTLFTLEREGGDVKKAARLAVEGHKNNYYILKLLASMADDIGDTAIVRKALFALADLDGKNSAAYRETYMRYYCSDVLNSKTE